MSRFEQAKRDAADLAARPVSRPVRRAIIARKLVRSMSWPDTAAGAVLSSCCAAHMGQLIGVRNSSGEELVVWMRPNGWAEVGGRTQAVLVDGVEYQPKREHFRMVAHARGRLAAGGSVHSPRRDDHPENRNRLPITLDCPTCGKPNLLDDSVVLPKGLGSPWRGDA